MFIQKLKTFSTYNITIQKERRELLKKKRKFDIKNLKT